MIEIKIKKDADKIYALTSKGHANYADKGKDIVCSAVSAILIGGLNAIKNIDDFKIIKDDGYLEILANKNISKDDQIVFYTIYIQLKTIEESYPKNLKIIIE